jgi:hypothetical protein
MKRGASRCFYATFPHQSLKTTYLAEYLTIKQLITFLITHLKPIKKFFVGKCGEYQIFFVTLQRNSEKDRLKAVRSKILDRYAIRD